MSIAQDPVVEIQSCHPSPLPAKKELLAPENSSPFNNAILDSFLEPKTKSGVKISANGPSTILDENGNLPEIQTDSDEDEDYLSPQPNKVQVANWAQTPYLRGALSAQQTKDPDAIFGEVKPIQLEGNTM